MALRGADRADPAARRLHPAAQGVVVRRAPDRPAPPRFPADPKVLERVVAAAFNQRRKMLRASLRGLDPQIEARLERLGIPPTARAEEIGLEAFCALARDLA
jgi:16S rRNA A1518/A1519 N6-dimethyltransferase RsmA/KsgA/DIM1 with predicted DNA glycosylase/AP lyase activity